MRTIQQQLGQEPKPAVTPCLVSFNLRGQHVTRDVMPDRVFALRGVSNGRPRVLPINVDSYFDASEPREIDLRHLSVVVLDQDERSNARGLAKKYANNVSAFVVLFQGRFSLLVAGDDATPLANAIARAKSACAQAVKEQEEKRREKRERAKREAEKAAAAKLAQSKLEADKAAELAAMQIGMPKSFVTFVLTSAACPSDNLRSVRYRPASDSGWNDVRIAHAYRDYHVAGEFTFWKVSYADTAAEAMSLDALTMAILASSSSDNAVAA